MEKKETEVDGQMKYRQSLVLITALMAAVLLAAAPVQAQRVKKPAVKSEAPPRAGAEDRPTESPSLNVITGQPADPCCNITAINARTGFVTAKNLTTGKTFRYQVDRAVLAGLKVGDKVHQVTSRKGPGEICCVAGDFGPPPGSEEACKQQESQPQNEGKTCCMVGTVTSTGPQPGGGNGSATFSCSCQEGDGHCSAGGGGKSSPAQKQSK